VPAYFLFGRPMADRPAYAIGRQVAYAF
jgi:hypothetical protein